MTLAVSTGAAVLALLGLALGLAVLLVVLNLFNRIVSSALEIDGYAKDILEGGVGIATNLDAVDDLVTTRNLATAVPGLAVAYLKKLGLVR